jgi:hypothetical protein
MVPKKMMKKKRRMMKRSKKKMVMNKLHDELVLVKNNLLQVLTH